MRFLYKIFKFFQRCLLKRGIFLTGFHHLSVSKEFLVSIKKVYFPNSSFDLVRLNFVYDSINRLKINKNKVCIAEFGVFNGHLSEYILSLLRSDDQLMLIDSFEGFLDKDFEKDQKIQTSKSRNYTFKDNNFDFKFFSANRNVRIYKGFIPEVLDQIDTSNDFDLCFVDLDLSNPTRDVLNFLHTRIKPQSVIFVHDYKNDFYPGIKIVCDDFLKNYSDFYHLSILPDNCGSAMLIRL